MENTQSPECSVERCENASVCEVTLMPEGQASYYCVEHSPWTAIGETH